jgi:hypothetical protein
MLTIRWSWKLGFTSPGIRGRRKKMEQRRVRHDGVREVLHLLGRRYEPAKNRHTTPHPIDALLAALPTSRPPCMAIEEAHDVVTLAQTVA